MPHALDRRPNANETNAAMRIELLAIRRRFLGPFGPRAQLLCQSGIVVQRGKTAKKLPSSLTRSFHLAGTRIRAETFPNMAQITGSAIRALPGHARSSWDPLEYRGSNEAYVAVWASNEQGSKTSQAS